jgi:hypothetical protein
MKDNWITLYHRETKMPIWMVRLSTDGYKKYMNNEPWDSGWVEVMMDYQAILKAEF